MTIGAVSIGAVDAADAAALARWNGVMRAAVVDGRDGVWWSSDDAVAEQFAHPRAGRRRFALIATDDDGSPAGAADVGIDVEEPAEVTIGVLPAYRRQGVGTMLWEGARSLLSRHAVAVVQSETASDAGVAFAESHGLTVANREYRMLRPRRDPAGSVTAVPDVEVRTWSDRVPDDLVEAWAALKTGMGEAVPVGDLTRRASATDVQRVREHERRMAAQGWILVRSMAILDDVGVGYTELFVVAAGADVIVQEDTFVDAEQRGRGIARLLKAANLRALDAVPAAARSRWVQTWTAIDNTPMLTLNRSLGFQVADTLFELEGRLS
ncbi:MULTISPECIES: GNAT family N-acetyltransferase [unclassified Microbacterium]|uniref:GNAT family N-acetyltransferase n=1 Tax=unclassified Microbacterium TaxID=2609290 RepID=UPI0012F965A1|nr:GNAT family N-acetyltransferase [Microbacterium sp. MAH-37]MVQ43111.1 N-acetyltransferase [Microbacterium sp. MAH-37]